MTWPLILPGHINETAHIVGIISPKLKSQAVEKKGLYSMWGMREFILGFNHSILYFLIKAL